MSMKLSRISAFSCVLLLQACQIFPRVSKGGSELAHAFGEISREGIPQSTCSPKLGELVEPPANQPQPIWQYMRAQLERMTSKNPQTFKGALEFSQFCLEVGDINETDVNASASPEGLLSFTAELFKVAQNDAQIAAVLAHELGHRSMGHLTKVGINKKLINDAEYTKFFYKATEARESLMAEILRADSILNRGFENLKPEVQLLLAAHGTNLKSLMDFDVSVRDSEDSSATFDFPKFFDDYLKRDDGSALIIGRQNLLNALENNDQQKFLKNERDFLAVLNEIGRLTLVYNKNAVKAMRISTQKIGVFETITWEEVEADEVGFEFFVRAGFDPQEYSKAFKTILESTSRGSVLDASITDKECKPPVFINIWDSHPDWCWRIKHIENVEAVIHEKDYKDFIEQGEHAANILNNGQDLKQIKSWIDDKRKSSSEDRSQVKDSNDSRLNQIIKGRN